MRVGPQAREAVGISICLGASLYLAIIIFRGTDHIASDLVLTGGVWGMVANWLDGTWFFKVDLRDLPKKVAALRRKPLTRFMSQAGFVMSLAGIAYGLYEFVLWIAS